MRRSNACLLVTISLLGFACGTTPPGGSGGAGGTGGREPVEHRAVATECDNERSNQPASVPEQYSGPVECRSHEECTAGVNGRCSGNGHDGWRCTYDNCFSDADCTGDDRPSSARVCECGGGFRSDNNVCLRDGNCRTDSDCPGSYCSPSFGSCGSYTGITSYYCHTARDECVNDTDCGGGAPGGGYCAFSPTAGYWKCSTSHCVG